VFTSLPVPTFSSFTVTVDFVFDVLMARSWCFEPKMVTQLANVREALVISAMFSFDFMVLFWLQILGKKHIAQNIAKFVFQ
jgi:hypothetical protein